MAVNKKAKKVVYLTEAPDGSKVEIHYTAKWSCFPELEHRADHFEYRGNISTTGYHSEFVLCHPDYKETEESVIEHARKRIEEYTNQKYGEPTQSKLL